MLTEEFTRQLQNEYGLDPASGDVTPIERLTALNDRQRETARILRETLEYYLAGNSNVNGKAYRDVLDRILREQAFTILNRLCALRMSEARGLVLESIAKGYQSKGFQLYTRLAGSALGETGESYRMCLFSLMDEFAMDLPVLFDRFSPQGRLFPREATLLKLLELINDPEIEPLWAEDETIGWIYQYFNSREERKAMRDASQAPRNSRELAVRNQFFTPRYVVEFLTDNTLGRIWYEMTKGETALKDTCHYVVRRPNEIFLGEGEAAPKQPETDENLSQEDLLLQPVYIPHRPLKDPREIKMLDPACGSMHFGLYAFDLFEQIYAEAWDLEERLGEDTLQRLADLDSLHKTYPDKETFVKDVPRLIIERNIHGVDIDPRAVQISGLSLWLRAQKSWHTQGLRPAERPQIHKSNVVCAEPMPGDRQMLDEFLSTLRGDGLEALMRKAWHVPADQKVRATQQMADALAKLVRTVWQEMELAGEAGSLLKIEETLRNAIAAARKESEEKAPLFRVLEYGLSESPKEKYVQVVAGKEQDFFDRAEELVLSALHDYANQAENGNGYKRRLFTEDTTQGFAFIDLCQKRYDVTVMNPPFGLATEMEFEKLRLESPDTYIELYASFIQRASSFTPVGLVGAITSRGFFTMTRLTQWRKKVFTTKTILVFDLGLDVMDNAFVRSSAYILSSYADRIPILIMDASKSNDRASLAKVENWNSVEKIQEGSLFIRLRQQILK
ncbi:MAG: SAM-dependent methyltransferase [Anaerolineaceae bacterium]